MAKKCLVIGTDTLSRTVDSNDRDSMIFADGAGATVVEERMKKGDFTQNYNMRSKKHFIFCAESYDPKSNSLNKHIKMNGRKFTNLPFRLFLML